MWIGYRARLMWRGKGLGRFIRGLVQRMGDVYNMTIDMRRMLTVVDM